MPLTVCNMLSTPPFFSWLLEGEEKGRDEKSGSNEAKDTHPFGCVDGCKRGSARSTHVSLVPPFHTHNIYTHCNSACSWVVEGRHVCIDVWRCMGRTPNTHHSTQTTVNAVCYAQLVLSMAYPLLPHILYVRIMAVHLWQCIWLEWFMSSRCRTEREEVWEVKSFSGSGFGPTPHYHTHTNIFLLMCCVWCLNHLGDSLPREQISLLSTYDFV